MPKQCAIGYWTGEAMRSRFAADYATGRVNAASCSRCGYGVSVGLDYSCMKCSGPVSAHMVDAASAVSQ